MSFLSNEFSNEMYSIPGLAFIGLCFLFSFQQVCVSAVSDRPSITHRYWISWFCMNQFIIEILAYFHFKNQSNVGIISGIRIVTFLNLLIGQWIAYKFIIVTISVLYESSSNKKTKVPLWFSKSVKYLMVVNILILVGLYLFAFISENAMGFYIYNMWLDLYYIIVSHMCIVILVQMILAIKSVVERTQISIVNMKLDVQKQQSNITDIDSDDENNSVIKKVDTFESTVMPKKSGHSKVMSSTEINRHLQNDVKNVKKLSFGLRKLKMIIAIIILVLLCVGYDLVTNIEWFIDSINSNKLKINVFISPYNTVFAYISHIIFNAGLIILMLNWIYVSSKCCSNVPANSLCFICCPVFDFKGKSIEYFKNVGITIDVHGKPLPKAKQKTESTKLTTTQRTDVGNVFKASPETNQIDLTNIGNNLTEYNKRGSVYDDGITPKIVLFNLDNSILSSKKILHCDINDVTPNDILYAFGGVSRIDMLIKYFDILNQYGATLFTKSDKNTKFVEKLLKKVNMDKYFKYKNGNNNETIDIDLINEPNFIKRIYGCEHEYNKDSKGSVSLFILKLMELTDMNNGSILYIDNDGNTTQIDNINLCKTYGIKAVKGLSKNDCDIIIQRFFDNNNK